MQPIYLPYNSYTGIIFTVLFFALMAVPIPQLVYFIHKNDTISCTSVLGLEVIIGVAIAFLVIKRVLPALKAEPALRLDEAGITSYIKNISINWTDIADIQLQTTRSSSYLTIIYDQQLGARHLIIHCQWIAGTDEYVYEKIIEYYRFYKPE